MDEVGAQRPRRCPRRGSSRVRHGVATPRAVVTIGCGVCGAEVEIAVRVRTKGATCWACGASIERHAPEGTVHTYAADPEARYRVRRTTGAPDSGRAHVGNFETFDDAQ